MLKRNKKHRRLLQRQNKLKQTRLKLRLSKQPRKLRQLKHKPPRKRLKYSKKLTLHKLNLTRRSRIWKLMPKQQKPKQRLPKGKLMLHLRIPPLRQRPQEKLLKLRH